MNKNPKKLKKTTNGNAATYLTIVLTIQGLCPSRGTASSISGWVFMKFNTSSGNEVEELNLDPWPAQPPGLHKHTRKKQHLHI